MVRYFLLATILLTSFFSSAQQIPFINAGEVIQLSKEQYDSGEYQHAINTLLTIPARDTAYTYMLSELAMACIEANQYDSAIAAAELGLKNPGEHRAHLLRSRAIAVNHKGDYEKAVSLFEQAIQQYPFDTGLMYNLGVIHYNHKAFDKARDVFFKILSISPFHAGSHLNLGRMAAGQGKKSHALMSLCLYLSVNSHDNDRLVLLETILSNQFKDEGTLPYTGDNAFEKLDQIIRAKVALDKNYKSLVAIDAVLVRQIQMFFEQLGTVNTTANDPWSTFYLSIYQALKAEDRVEPFLYHLLTSTENKDVKKWLQKNDKKLQSFYTTANVAMTRKRATQTYPAKGFTTPTQAWYDSDNRLDALGVTAAGDVRQGPWVYVGDNGEVSAEGKYSNEGKKIGTWTYYRADGTVSSVENLDTGEIKLYEHGAISEHYYLKNDQIDGEVNVYLPCGVLTKKFNYKQGKRHGKGISYFASGKVRQTFTYDNGNLSGELLTYYENGVLKEKENYDAGKLTGKYAEYFATGKVKSAGQLTAGLKTGVWTYYHANGRVSYKGSYANDVATGEWLYFNTRGEKTEKRTFNEGKLHGEYTSYHNGVAYNTDTYKNDALVSVVYFDSKGKETARVGNSDGNFTAKRFNPMGQRVAEGAYKKGVREGLWKYYYPEGSQQSQFTFKNGVREGDGIEYFHSKGKKFISHYTDGELDGYFQEFFPNGKVKQEGTFVAGQRMQQWLTYFADGTRDTDYYYLYDELSGTTYDYNGDGQLLMEGDYNATGITDIRLYTGKEPKQRKTAEQNGRVTYESLYKNGKVRTSYAITCGAYTRVEKKYPDGKPIFSYNLLSGSRDGAYSHFGLNGQLLNEGKYVGGVAEGTWKAYDLHGNSESMGTYLNGVSDSTWIFTYFTGKTASTAEYLDDDRNGVARFYGSDGQLLVEKLYYAGDLVAFRKATLNEKPEDWTTFTGQQTITAKYPDGTLAYEAPYVNGALEGIRKIFYSNGKPYSEYTYSKGDYHGAYTIYYATGNVREKGNYKFDQRDGAVEIYNEDGSRFSTEHYVMGMLQGKATLYNKGAVKVEYNFFGGVPNE